MWGCFGRCLSTSRWSHHCTITHRGSPTFGHRINAGYEPGKPMIVSGHSEDRKLLRVWEWESSGYSSVKRGCFVRSCTKFRPFEDKSWHRTYWTYQLRCKSRVFSGKDSARSGAILRFGKNRFDSCTSSAIYWVSIADAPERLATQDHSARTRIFCKSPCNCQSYAFLSLRHVYHGHDSQKCNRATAI